ncbi:unnamed protein product [Ectocarpus sp. 4 AP-2014]
MHHLLRKTAQKDTARTSNGQPQAFTTSGWMRTVGSDTAAAAAKMTPAVKRGSAQTNTQGTSSTAGPAACRSVLTNMVNHATFANMPTSNQNCTRVRFFRSKRH